jgi:hypothetical protein
MSEIRAATVSNLAGTGPVTLTGQYAAKAWVNFNGTGTVAIRESGNVSSITDNGTGDYTANFTTAMTDANYAATVGSIEQNNTGGRGNLTGTYLYATSSVNLISARSTTASVEDAFVVSLSVHR